eukprot:1158606-Pelagomonas_calceolata.AAC.6
MEAFEGWLADSPAVQDLHSDRVRLNGVTLSHKTPTTEHRIFSLEARSAAAMRIVCMRRVPRPEVPGKPSGAHRPEFPGSIHVPSMHPNCSKIAFAPHAPACYSLVEWGGGAT